MMRILAIISVLLLGCVQEEKSEQYSIEFQNHMRQGGVELRSDSLIFPESANFEIITMPNELNIDTEYLFENELNEKVFLKRLNYTDYKYHFKTKQLNEEGIVSLYPNFHLGAEFRGDYGELVIAPFYPTVNNPNNCLLELGIGNHSIEEGEIDVFITLSLKKECEQLKKTVFKLKK